LNTDNSSPQHGNSSLGSSGSYHGRPLVLSARRGGDTPSFFFPPSPSSLLSLSVVEQGNGENHNAVGERPAGARSRGVGTRSRAAQGQRCLDARGSGAQAERATWLLLYGRQSPWWCSSRGQRGLSPLGVSPGEHARATTRRRAGRAVRPSHQACVRARLGAHTLVWKRKKVWRNG
jgi:hypothetical protein